MADQHADEGSEAPQAEGYEQRDANLKGLLWVTLVSIIIIVIAILWVKDLFLTTREALITEMVLQPESAALRELRAQETDMLENYRILDAAKGIYQIPINRAMELMAQEAYSTGQAGKRPAPSAQKAVP